MQIATDFFKKSFEVMQLTSYACTQIATETEGITWTCTCSHILRLYADCNQKSNWKSKWQLPHILRLYADCNSKDAQNYKMPARILCAGFQTVHTQFTLPRVSTTFRGKNYAYCLDSRTMSCPDLVRTSQLFCGSFRFALHF